MCMVPHAVTQGCRQTCHSAIAHASFDRFSKYFKQPIHSRLGTPLCSHSGCVFTLSAHAWTKTNNNLACQSRMDRQHSDSVEHFSNCFSLTFWDAERGDRQITYIFLDKDWQVKMHSSNRVFPTIHDKGVPGPTPVINKVFVFKNDLHAGLHTSTRWLNGLDSQVCIPVCELCFPHTGFDFKLMKVLF